MNNRSVHRTVSTFLFGSLLIPALFLCAGKALATPIPHPVNSAPSARSGKIFVRYTGNQNDALLFSVQYNNEEGKDFRIEIANEAGEVVYRGDFKERQFSKTFELPKSLEFSKLSFVIQTGRERFEQTFNINIVTRTVEDVVVSRN